MIKITTRKNKRKLRHIRYLTNNNTLKLAIETLEKVRSMLKVKYKTTRAKSKTVLLTLNIFLTVC